MLEVENLVSGYGKKEIVHGISFAVDRGEFVCVIGANGCGKTTALKSMLGLIPSMSGSVRIDGVETSHMQEKERAKHFAYIPQAHTPPFPFSVADVVLMGRTPYVNRLAVVMPEDRRIAHAAMCQLGIERFADRVYTELSGGQQQLVLIARALAQQPDVLIMDEPTASLDFGNQQMVLSRMKDLTSTGTSVLMVTHDPDHALFCATKVIAMQEGRILSQGDPLEVMTTERLRKIYGTKVRMADAILDNGETTKVCIPF